MTQRMDEVNKSREEGQREGCQCREREEMGEDERERERERETGRQAK
jgi:hypothetical protein